MTRSWVTVAERPFADSDLEEADQQVLELVKSLGGDYGACDQRPALLRPRSRARRCLGGSGHVFPSLVVV